MLRPPAGRLGALLPRGLTISTFMSRVFSGGGSQVSAGAPVTLLFAMAGLCRCSPDLSGGTYVYSTALTYRSVRAHRFVDCAHQFLAGCTPAAPALRCQVVDDILRFALESLAQPGFGADAHGGVQVKTRIITQPRTSAGGAGSRTPQRPALPADGNIAAESSLSRSMRDAAAQAVCDRSGGFRRCPAPRAGPGILMEVWAAPVPPS